jgi:succinylglutamate desuccinylase
MSGGPRGVPRCLGTVSGSAEGPTVIITGGIHGNEPAGVLAARAVLRDLRSIRSVLRGKVIAFSGNRCALERGVRFLSRDLNRGWVDAELERLSARSADVLATEDREQRELHEEIRALERESSRLVFLDLHTTSGPTEPFVCFSDTVENRNLACALPVNVVLGLEKSVHASMLTWASERGHVGVSFEAGQHADRAACTRHVGAVWMLLVATGVVDPASVPNESEHVAALTLPAGGSRVVEVRHRHVVEAGDDFEMLGGFEGFDPIAAGQIVACDRRGPIRAPEAGLMLMPRYQAQGEDGFFVAREIACQSIRAT